MKYWWLAVLCTALAFNGWAQSAIPSERDAQAEQRLAAIAAELRCLVCQNESIAGSRADLAVDLRQQIREQIAMGKSDQQIMAYMVERYGDFVLYRPPLKNTTLLLWFGPAMLLIAGLVALVINLRRRSMKVDTTPLSDSDSQRAEALLRKNSDIGKQS